MSTTSTGSLMTSRVSATVVAVPTIRMSGSSPRTRERVSRSRRWSSTSITRTGRGVEDRGVERVARGAALSGPSVGDTRCLSA